MTVEESNNRPSQRVRGRCVGRWLDVLVMTRFAKLTKGLWHASSSRSDSMSSLIREDGHRDLAFAFRGAFLSGRGEAV
jgi:hypothetical protein